jgi:MFS transporter, DHA1 family, multidrug resistance protein
MLSALLPLSFRMYTPSFLGITKTFMVHINSVQYTLVIFFFVISIFDLSFKKQVAFFGEKAVFVGLSVFIAGSLLAAISGSIAMLYIARIFQGFGAACAAVNTRSKVTTLFDLKERVFVYGVIGILMSLMLLPDTIIAGFITASFGWGSVFIFLALFAATAFFLYVKNIYQKNDLRQPLVDHKSQPAVRKNQVFLLLMAAFQFGGYTLFLVGSTRYFLLDYGLSPEHYGALFFLIALGYFFASLCVSLVSRFIQIPPFHLAIIGLMLSLLSASLGYAFSVNHFSAHLVWYFLFMMCYQMGTRLINLSSNVLLIQGKNPAKASAYVGTVKYFFAGTLSLTAILATHQLSEMFLMILMGSVMSCLFGGLYFVGNKNNNASCVGAP